MPLRGGFRLEVRVQRDCAGAFERAPKAGLDYCCTRGAEDRPRHSSSDRARVTSGAVLDDESSSAHERVTGPEFWRCWLKCNFTGKHRGATGLIADVGRCHKQYAVLILKWTAPVSPLVEYLQVMPKARAEY